MDDVEPLLTKAGFDEVVVQCKEESKEFIKDWLPGSGAEQFVVSANITARKPSRSVCEEAKVVEEEPPAAGM